MIFFLYLIYLLLHALDLTKSSHYSLVYYQAHQHSSLTVYALRRASSAPARRLATVSYQLL
jgi:hypothetical protein